MLSGNQPGVRIFPQPKTRCRNCGCSKFAVPALSLPLFLSCRCLPLLPISRVPLLLPIPSNSSPFRPCFAERGEMNTKTCRHVDASSSQQHLLLRLLPGTDHRTQAKAPVPFSNPSSQGLGMHPPKRRSCRQARPAFGLHNRLIVLASKTSSGPR